MVKSIPRIPNDFWCISKGGLGILSGVNGEKLPFPFLLMIEKLLQFLHEVLFSEHFNSEFIPSFSKMIASFKSVVLINVCLFGFNRAVLQSCSEKHSLLTLCHKERSGYIEPFPVTISTGSKI